MNSLVDLLDHVAPWAQLRLPTQIEPEEQHLLRETVQSHQSVSFASMHAQLQPGEGPPQGPPPPLQSPRPHLLSPASLFVAFVVLLLPVSFLASFLAKSAFSFSFVSLSFFFAF